MAMIWKTAEHDIYNAKVTRDHMEIKTHYEKLYLAKANGNHLS